MPVVEGLLWVVGFLLVCGLAFWVWFLVPSRNGPRLADGWGWLQWRPFPHDLPQWMIGGFAAGFLLQLVLGLAVWADGEPRVPPGVLVLLSILMFQGLLAWIFYQRLRAAGLHPLGVLGMDPPLRVSDMVGGLVAYCMSLPLVALASLISRALYTRFELQFAPQPLLEEFMSVAGWWNWVTLFLLVGFIGPLLEEVVFRGFLFTWLRQRMGSRAGLWVQAAVFALFHQHGASFLPLFAMSVVLALAYVATRRLMVCVWMHAMFNTLTLVNTVWLLGGGDRI